MSASNIISLRLQSQQVKWRVLILNNEQLTPDPYGISININVTNAGISHYLGLRSQVSSGYSQLMNGKILSRQWPWENEDSDCLLSFRISLHLSQCLSLSVSQYWIFTFNLHLYSNLISIFSHIWWFFIIIHAIMLDFGFDMFIYNFLIISFNACDIDIFWVHPI